jgi:Spy/CpxP family protein refolding chaperone
MSGPLKPWVAMGLIFVVGIVTGAALTVGWRSEWAHPPGAKQMQDHWLGRLDERLHLTPDQETKIEPILTAASIQLKGLHRDEMDRIGKIFETTDAQISPLLTPDQQAEFEKMHEERHHLRHWGPRPGPEGPPPEH